MRKDMLVKVEAQYPISGGPPILVSGGGGRGGARGKRERFGRAIGGAVGGLGAIAGKHRSLGSLLQSIVSGYAQGKDLGGGFGRVLVSPERQAVIDYRHAKRMAEAKANAANAPTMARRLGRGVGRLQNFANRFKQTPVEEVAVTPEGKQLPAQAGVIGPEFQLNAPPSKVAVEPLVLGQGDWTEEEIRDDPRNDTSKIAVKPERGIERGKIRVTGEGQGAKPQRDNKAGWGLSSKWGQNDVPVYAPSESSKLYSDQAASDAALQANAAAATQKLMQTPPPSPLQTVSTAAAGLNTKEQMAANDAQNYDTVPEHAQDGGPTVEQAGEQAAQNIGVAVEQGRRQTPGEKMMERGFPALNEDLTQAGKDADSLMASKDRLPVVGIRKARTRRVLIV